MKKNDSTDDLNTVVLIRSITTPTTFSFIYSNRSNFLELL